MDERMTLPKGSLWERALANLDAAPWGALYRAAIGLALVPSLEVLTRSADTGWWLLPWFVAVLAGLRVLPALLRKRWHVSPELSAIWLDRRVMAKRYDSYQWRKLLWTGVGLGTYVAWRGPVTWPVAALAIFCLCGGIAGSVVFRARMKADRSSAHAAPRHVGQGSHGATHD
jgi:hypothetical protein